MGLFDDTPYDISNIPVNSGFSYGDTNAFMIGAYGGARGMVSSVGKIFGFQDEEDMLLEIYDNADMSTPEGIQDAVNAVMKINPEEGRKLQKQVLEAAQAEESTANIKLQIQTNELASIKALKSGTWATDWQLDAGPTGAAVTLQNWLRANGYKSEEIADITTTAQAATFLNERIDTGASGTIRIMQEYMNNSRNMYIENKMYQTYNERHNIDTPKIDATGAVVNTDENDFDAALTEAGNSDGNTTTAVTNGRTSFSGKTLHDLTQTESLREKRSDITPTDRFSHLR